MKMIEAIRAALDAAHIGSHRLAILAVAAERSGVLPDPFALGKWCKEVGATADELGCLLLHRAALKGIREKGDLIPHLGYY